MEIDIQAGTSIDDICAYLKQQSVGDFSSENSTIEIPGAGNMNIVLRIKYPDGSIILKQSKPFVQKYPSIPAPIDRIYTEERYYHYIKEIPGLDHFSPEIIFFDRENHILLLEDLGDIQDFSSIYQAMSGIPNPAAIALIKYISALHAKQWNKAEADAFPDNLALRKLNHAHIFVLPFTAENGFNLDDIQPGLAAIAASYQADQNLQKAVHTLGEKYLRTGNTLLHGDYYPGSWMENSFGQINIIDPEFSFMGSAEFDLGVFCAHHLMANGTLDTILDCLEEYYKNFSLIDQKLLLSFMAVEVFRRIIGLAQLPLMLTLDQKAQLLQQVKPYIQAT